jgi:hypothetical protein
LFPVGRLIAAFDKDDLIAESAAASAALDKSQIGLTRDRQARDLNTAVLRHEHQRLDIRRQMNRCGKDDAGGRHSWR